MICRLQDVNLSPWFSESIKKESKHTCTASAAGTKTAGSRGYRKVVATCNGGATSETRFNTSSACKERVEVPVGCAMVMLCSWNCINRKSRRQWLVLYDTIEGQ